jgi:muconolactone delta-isomerase
MMEFLVQFELDVPDGVGESEVEDCTAVLGLYQADSEAELESFLDALPRSPWMRTSITPLAPHPNDPARIRAGG